MAAAVSADDLPDFVDSAKVKRLNQYAAAVIASLGGFVFGVSLGWNSSAGDTLRNVLDASSLELGLIGGIFNAGAGVGIIFLPLLAKYFAPTTIMLTSFPLSVIGWLFICIGHRKTITLILGRSICGFGSGMFCILAPIYVAEIADREARGRLLMLFQLLVNVGIMLAFLLAHLLDERKAVWRYSLICGLACFVIAFVRLLPESPLYHLTKGQQEAAKKSLRWFRGDEYKLEDEFEEYKKLATISGQKRKTWQLGRNVKVLRPVMSCIVVFASQQLSGMSTLTSNALTVFNIGGSGELTGSEQTLVAGALQIASCLLATILLDVFGRRTLLTLSSALMGLFLALLGMFCKLRDVDPEYDDIYWWMPPTWMSLFFAAYNLGVGPISYAMLGDIFPMEIKMAAAVVIVSCSFFISLLSTLTFVELFITFGPAETMWLFSGFCWLGALFCAFIIRDVGKKSLYEIQGGFDIDNSSNEARENAH